MIWIDLEITSEKVELDVGNKMWMISARLAMLRWRKSWPLTQCPVYLFK